MAKLANEFPKKKWKKCCGKGCGDCTIYHAYVEAYGKKDGHKRFKSDYEKRH